MTTTDIPLPHGAVKIPSDGPSYGLSRRIGTVTLHRASEYRKSYETAAWHKTLACQPQTVPLYTNGYWVTWTFAGTVTDAYFPTLFGGVVVGNSFANDAKEIGNTDTHHVSTYAYAVAEAIGTGKPLEDDLTIALDPGYSAAPKFVAEYGDGEPRTHWALTMPADGHPLDIARKASESYKREGLWEHERVTYGVTYQGDDKGTVTVDVRQRDRYDCPETKALRVAEAQVFGLADR